MPPKLKVAKNPASSAVTTDPAGDEPAPMSDVERMTYPDLVERKGYIDERLEIISVPDVAKKRSKPVGSNGKRSPKSSSPSNSPMDTAAAVGDDGEIPYSPKADTHWDFVMKEMMWLGADFQAERKRQISLAKKCASSVRQFHKTKEARRLRELTQAEFKRRKLAARIGREVKGWWSKLDKVIAFRQKMQADEERKKAMNKQLIVLVQQTEKYTESLGTHSLGDTTTDDDDDSESDGQSAMEEDSEADARSTGGESGESISRERRRRRKTRKRYLMTIEEALASENKRKSKSRVVDYARMKLEATQFYGESTASDASGSDESFSEPDDSAESDDDSTLRAAIEEELQERNKKIFQPTRSNESFLADPEELRKLYEEQNMDVQLVVERLKYEHSEEEHNDQSSILPASKRVKFAESVEQPTTTLQSPKVDPGEDADDDGDASDVEDYDEAQNSDEEYEAGEIEADDETTIAQEEGLPKDMSYTEEIELLKKSAEMPIEELRKMYSNLQQQEEREAPIDRESDTSSSGNVFDSDDLADEEEYVADEQEMDDETTIAQEESLPRDLSYSEELDLLKQGAEMPIEELRKMYANLGAEDGSEEDEENSAGFSSDDNDDAEYEEAAVPEVDDETTIEAEERLGRDMTYEEELNILQRENEMSVEDLRALYAGINEADEGGDDPLIEKNDQGDSGAREMQPRQVLRSRKRTRDENVIVDEAKSKRSKSEMEIESDDGTAALSALEASAEKARQTLASRPFLLAPWVKLRMYQQIGLNWLVSLQTRRLNGILADEMGLGKTLQTISLLAYLASYKGIWGPHLVIVPTSVIINWETELKRFCPGLKVLCYYGSAKRRKELRTGWTKTNWYHVVITSYQLAVQDSFAFKRKKWYYLILDEAQNIKNFQSQRWQTLINFNTQRRLLLTGTPLQNSLMELWSLLHFLMPYIFRSRKEFSYWFSNPMNSIIEGTANRNDDVIKRLHGIIRPFVLRRLKKDVETQMPGKFEHIVKCQLSRRQMTLYEEFLSRSSTRQALKKGGNFMGMMNVLMQLRKTCDTACDNISDSWMKPLWSGSSGKPSFEAALRHNIVEADGLRRLKARREPVPLVFKDSKACPEELQALVAEIYNARRRAGETRFSFQNNLNRRRCDAPPFPLASTFLDSVEVETNIIHRRQPVEVRKRRVVETALPLLSLRKSEMQRAVDLGEMIEKFVFCVPSAGAMPMTLDNGSVSSSHIPKSVEAMLLEPIEELLRPYRKAHARLSSFFPDKKLVQYDAGKLQTLAQLLRTLKHGGHRALIFTQMSKMLDILEAFLNIHGFTYLRLDGATGVDRRQRYMDRFNNDTRIFCFILSTRSGGMGINLTGADTVIFYDSDWNPAMDAQAQDRAHRIGQTRDVHIYRLITEHTIEENILSKAKQKKNLDIMVMDHGKFDAVSAKTKDSPKPVADDNIEDVYTKKGLQAILGVADDDPSGDSAPGGDSKGLSKEQMEIAMTALEDEDDVKALRGAQKEAADELKEFDENAEIQKNSEDEEDEAEGEAKKANEEPLNVENRKEMKITDTSKEPGNDDDVDQDELEREFAAWQSSEGFDGAGIENSLSPMERYGLHFHENIDPFYSIFLINEERRKMEGTEGDNDLDIEELERMKAMEERQAMEDGDLLATKTRPEDLVRQRNLYRREKTRLRSDKKRRRLKGEDWSQRVDGLTQKLFWYNEDTGEAVWDTPHIVTELREDDLAKKEGWSKLPLKPLVHIMDYLAPFPDRQSCSSVCRQWKIAGNDVQFVRHVYPVEMGALATESARRDHNHFVSISDALQVALPGDTIELSDGHYYVSEPGLIVDKQLKFVGDENNPANVVIEMSGSIQWTGKGGWIEGITFRRPKIVTGSIPNLPILEIKDRGKIDMIQCIFDNEPSTGPVVVVSGTGNKGHFDGVSIRNGKSGGVQMNGPIQLKLTNCMVRGNAQDGVDVGGQSSIEMKKCKVSNNKGFGLRFAKGSRGIILQSHFVGNAKGVLLRQSGCNLSCSTNTAIVSVVPVKQIPGFKLTVESKSYIPNEVPRSFAPHS